MYSLQYIKLCIVQINYINKNNKQVRERKDSTMVVVNVNLILSVQLATAT